MKTTKKLFIICLVALMTCVAMMPSTFSWYTHNSVVNGGFMQYSRSALPVSGSSGVNVKTVAVDKDGKETNGTTAVTAVNFSSADTNIQYYKTTIKNNSSPSGDVYGDLELGDLLNNAKIKAGITSPVINEKGFDISKTPAANDKVRIYFVPTTAYQSFWYNGDTNSADFDMNIRYFISGVKSDVKMTRQSNNNKFKDANTDEYPTYIYYYDLPSNVNSFFFFNHWFDKEHDAENNDWNRTPDISGINPGTVYRLTGKNIEDSYKLYDTVSSTNVAACMKYYSEVQLDMDGYIDISLKKTNESSEEDFSPDYYGTSISYISSDTSVATVNSDGLVTAASTINGNSATANITTTITGTNGDSIQKTTLVTVSKYIKQMPIAQNILVEKGKSVDIYWYVINKTNQTGNIASSIFWTY
ncbi:MAG: hypothetical protein K6F88_04640 [Ruminococcus sp.]|nr:hypothetical protein [Ruminococcus sp.]